MGLKRQADNDVEEIDDCQEVVTVPGPRRPHKGQALSSRFSPVAEAIDDSCCYARVQHGTKVGQCTRKRLQEWFCAEHAAENRWRLLGRVDGEIPKAQLVHLLRRAAAPATPGDPEVERRSQRKVLRSASLKALNFDELTGIAQDLAPALTDKSHEEVLEEVMRQQEEDLWREVMRVHQMDGGKNAG
ncbi:unnamed protein product [Durusdinium trenchii]|uniref:Uncharacterized protein n=2 Tax=Durusdinium trenchii TaxID=1381693 RepID=A0ABP0QEJ0_9DINO